MRKKSASLLCLLCLPLLLWAQRYSISDNGSKVSFSIVNHLLMDNTVQGTLSGLKGTAHFNPNSLGTASITATVAASTINTGIAMRDNHLKKEEYFDVAHYPTLSLKSTSIVNGKTPNQYLFKGKLTLKKTTQEISFPFTATPQNGGYLLKGSFKINRRDFDVGPDNSIDDMLTVNIVAQALP